MRMLRAKGCLEYLAALKRFLAAPLTAKATLPL